MANSFTPLITTAYESTNKVSREMSGMAKSVYKSVEAQRVGKNQKLSIPIVGPMAIEEMQASNISSTGSDIPVSTADVTINRFKKVSFHVEGEEKMAIGDQNYMDIFSQSLEQALRTLTNAVETDLCNVALNSSRAHGAANSLPFGTKDDLSDFSYAAKILNDNGCPTQARSMVLNTGACAELKGKQSSIFKVDESGSMEGRELGYVGNLLGFAVRESTQFAQHVQGSVAGTFAIDNGAGYEVGDTTLSVDGTTNGDSIKKGDIVSIAGSDQKYVIAKDASDAFTEIEIQKPGLVDPVSNNAVISFEGNYTPSVAFDRNAFLLVMRPPALPEGGDAASDEMIFMDDESNLVYRLATYRQYLQASFEVQACWAVKEISPAHSAILLGT